MGRVKQLRANTELSTIDRGSTQLILRGLLSEQMFQVASTMYAVKVCFSVVYTENCCLSY